MNFRCRGFRAACAAGAVAAVALLNAGCAAPAPYIIRPTAERVGLATLLSAYPLGGGDNIYAVALDRSEAMSAHFVQIRDREPPHTHAMHDLAVTLLRGEGTLYIHGRGEEMRPGDAAIIPRGTPHYFVNRGPDPAAALVIFAPPYDGIDQVPVRK